MPKSIITIITITCIYITCITITKYAAAQENNNQWLFKADTITHQPEISTTTAQGNVNIKNGKQQLSADKIIYNQKNNLLTATGNVTLIDEDENENNSLTADYIEITSDFKNAIIKNMQANLGKVGRITAEEAQKEGHISKFKSSTYTACDFCVDKPNEPPLWILKADRVIHDQKEKHLEYFDTHLRFAGVPVFYLPYFVYPDPTVKRESGFLFSKFGSDKSIGSHISVPFFIPFNEHSDVTLNPIFTTKGGQIASGKYRARFERAKIDIEASHTQASQNKGDNVVSRFDDNADRWHLNFDSETHINEYWRAGLKINRASDRNYFRRYPFWNSPGNFLKSTIYAERFKDRNYLSAVAFSFQDLRVTDSESAAKVYPNIDGYFYGDRDNYGGFWNAYGNVRFLDQSNFLEGRRAYGRLGYELPFYSSLGYIGSVDFNLYSNLSSVDFETQRDSYGYLVRDENSSRILPQIGLRWEMPFRRFTKGGSQQIIKPKFALYASPNDMNNANINNSDSSIFALESNNIMLAHRFNGVDRFDGGQRLSYGLEVSHNADSYDLEGFIGQTYEFSEDEVVKREFNIVGGSSDIITSFRVGMDLLVGNDYDLGRLEWDNQAQIGANDGTLNRYFSQLSLGNADYLLSANYLTVRPVGEKPEQQQLSFTSDNKLAKYWRGGIFATIDWTDSLVIRSSRTRSYGGRLTYEDECFSAGVIASRDFTKNPDVRDGYSVLFTVNLKTLAGVFDEPLESNF